MSSKPTSPISSLAHDLGFCCLYAFFRANKHLRTGRLAYECGVTPQAIRYHRKRMRQKLLCCDNSSACVPCMRKRFSTLGL